jgi:hypothetical protein
MVGGIVQTANWVGWGGVGVEVEVEVEWFAGLEIES